MIHQEELLGAVYQKAVGARLNGAEKNQRIEMQKIVYLLREKGINCGEYAFVWDEMGPFSLELNDDLKKRCSAASNIQFSKDAERELEWISGIIEENKKEKYYDDAFRWLEAIASIHYLSRYMHATWNQEAIMKKLKELKPRLNNQAGNQRAYQIAMGL